MTSLSRLAAIGLITFFSASAAFAEADALKSLDANKDGAIDLNEAKAGGSKVLSKVNSDKDGTVDAKELSGRVDAAGIKAADPDADGTLDESEYGTLVEERFKAANSDGDATIEEDELSTPEGKALLILVN